MNVSSNYETALQNIIVQPTQRSDLNIVYLTTNLWKILTQIKNLGQI